MIPDCDQRTGQAAIGAKLHELLGSRFTQNPSVANQYVSTEGHCSDTMPWGVVKPASEAEIQCIHQICSAHRMPLIPFGAGSSVEGQLAALGPSLMLDTRGLDQLVDVDVQSMTARVQSGVTRLQLERALRDTGLFFPVDPGADATIGGMAATRASGTNAVRYGTMRENTLALNAVLSDGSLISCGAETAKASNGYDLLHLFVGSEGTLGTITELTIRLYPRPEHVSGAVFCFPDVASAVAATTDFRQASIPVARVELLDGLTIRALNRYSNIGLSEAPTLLVELHGDARSVAAQSALVRDFAAENGGTEAQHVHSAAERSKLWDACHKRYYACRAMRPGAIAIATDICVPISRLVETIDATLADMETMSFPITLHGHVGDGNFHTLGLLDAASEAEMKAFKSYSERLALRAIAVGGTCSGEHGIGIGKQRFLREEHSHALAWMQRIKQLFDPHGIMNPGKNVDIR